MQNLYARAGNEMRPSQQPGETVTCAGQGPCAQCPVRASNICSVLQRLTNQDEASADDSVSWQSHKKIPAHKNVKSVGDRAERVLVICEGWAFRFAQLTDGRKQILSILIPGDVITPMRLFDDAIRFSVQALTDMRYCGYSRATLRARLTGDLALLDAWAKLLVAERQHNIGLVVNLGARSADERIAHLLLQLSARLERRGLATGRRGDLPLPQRVIAAATGLTPEHVSRVIGKFRSAGLIETVKGGLSVRDLAGLQRVGALNF
jgi:CRP-like cAMP-binding protein